MTVKKIIAILSAAILTLTFCGCSKRQSEFDSDTGSGYGTHHAVITVKDYGDIKLVLDGDTAPITVKNFVELAKSGFYDGLTFHRIIKGFMIQGGDPKGNGTGGESIWGGKFDGGVSDALCHVRGAVAYANSGSYTADGSQFYIVTGGPVDEETLDSYEKNGYGPYTKEQRELYTTIGGTPWLDGSYTVFGQVIEGLDIAIQIANDTETDASNKPYTAVRMSTVTVEPYDGSPIRWYASDSEAAQSDEADS